MCVFYWLSLGRKPLWNCTWNLHQGTLVYQNILYHVQPLWLSFLCYLYDPHGKNYLLSYVCTSTHTTRLFIYFRTFLVIVMEIIMILLLQYGSHERVLSFYILLNVILYPIESNPWTKELWHFHPYYIDHKYSGMKSKCWVFTIFLVVSSSFKHSVDDEGYLLVLSTLTVRSPSFFS